MELKIASWSFLVCFFLAPLSAGAVTLSGSTDGLAEGDTLTLECSSNQGDSLELFKNGSPIQTSGRVSVSPDTPSSTVTVVIEDLEVQDSGMYTCRSVEDYFDEAEVHVTVQGGTGERALDIVDPEGDSLEVAAGGTLNMKCRGGRSSSPEWQHNGYALSTSAPGGRVIITDSVDYNTGDKVSMLSREEMTEREAGVYKCQDRNDYFNNDDVNVKVEGSSEQAGVEIFEPTESKLRLLPAHMLNLKCQSDKSTELKWGKDGNPVENEQDGFIINVSIDDEKGVKTSMLSKQQAEATDSGIYTCSSLDDSSSDQVSVLVADEAETAGHEGAASNLHTSGIILAAMATVAIAMHA